MLLQGTGWESSYHIVCCTTYLFFKKTLDLALEKFFLGAVQLVLYVCTYLSTWCGYRSLSQSNFLGIRSHYPQNSTGVVFCRRLAVGLVPPKTLTVGYLHRASGVWIRLLGPAVVTFVYQNPTRSFYTKSNYSTTPQNHHSTSQNNFKNQIFEQFTMPASISILETCNI